MLCHVQQLFKYLNMKSSISVINHVSHPSSVWERETDTKNSPKQVTHLVLFFSPQEPSKVSVCGTRVTAYCRSHYTMAHQQLSGSFLRRWSGRGSWKAKQTGGLQICTRVESMKQVDGTFPGRLPPRRFKSAVVTSQPRLHGKVRMCFCNVLIP